MTKHSTPKFPVGTVITESNKNSRIIAILDDMVVMRPTDADANDHLDFSMTIQDLNSKMDAVDFEIELPPLKTLYGSTALPKEGPDYIDLNDEEQLKVLFELCAMNVLTEYLENGLKKVTEAWINDHHEEIEGKVKKQFRRLIGQKQRKSKSTKSFDLPAGKKLARQFKDYQSEFFDPSKFATKHSRAGRPEKEFPSWVNDLIHKCAKDYLDGREKTVKRGYILLEGELYEENARRAATDPGHVDIKVSETKFRKIVASMPRTAVMATRKGRAEMIRNMRTGIGETIARMVGEVIQIDECELPLWVFLEKTGLHHVVGERTMNQLRKDAENENIGKVWILVAYDVATGTPLAFNIARSQNANDTLELIRRLVSDKTKLAREAGCQHAPPPAVRPFQIVMDTGSGLWNRYVPTAILSLGAMFRFGRTKSPTDKAFIERFFATLGSDIVRALHGHSGDGPGSNTDYDGKEMTALTIAQVEKYIWWYFTDCLPFKKTQRKGGWGIQQKHLFDQTVELYGKLPPLSRRHVRRALGLKVRRVVTKMGIEAFRMPFQGDVNFRKWALDNIGAEVTVYVDPHSIEEVTVKTDKGEIFHLRASLSQFRDFTLQEWVHFLEEWRASDAVSKEISAMALYRFYKRLDAEMEKLLDFYGKEHKVIALDEAQSLCDELAGGDLTILEPDEGSKAAAPMDVYMGCNEGVGIFVPGSDIEDAEIIEEASPTTPGKSKAPKTFTGVSKGKGGLK
ncbi:hypothetical protein [Thalassospira alkalitolerans]|uniref:hypothetical protein n=1 Tax=Thalassospira alkalitolerans TaxID=1293890 RepID=UPI003AA8CF6B